MQTVKFTEALYPHNEGDLLKVDDVSAKRVVEAGVGVIVDENGDPIVEAAKAPIEVETVKAPETAPETVVETVAPVVEKSTKSGRTSTF